MKLFLSLLFFFPLAIIAQESFQFLQQKEVQPNGFVLSWMAEGTALAAVEYGTTPQLELGMQRAKAESQAIHQVQLTNLKPAHFYYVRPLLIHGLDTIIGEVGYYSTQSNSSGEIRVLFNQGIDSLYSNGTSPYIQIGGAAFENEIINMINQATTSIDIAVYNTTRSAIVAALTAAHNNGIRVRYIANSGTMTSNAALKNPAPPFPVFYVNTTDLMHNKFMVIDANSTTNAWVWTGSTNWTYTDMYTNYNNAIAIQDQALAQAYVMEFEEMWGSNNATYNAGLSKVGALKTDNTPHTFNIGGKVVELYFSPSDQTTDQIETALYSADHDIEFCLLTYTRNELGTAMRNEHLDNVFEHGIIENVNDFGSEFNWLVGQGVNVLADNHATDLHHKYAVIDAGNTNSDPKVVTGSHNWTTAAEDRNDENTLIVHDPDVANWYLQEFTLRWCEVKNNINCSLPFTVYSTTSTLKDQTKDLDLYPNPCSNQLSLELKDLPQTNLEVELYTTAGQLVEQYHWIAQSKVQQYNLSHLEAGMYIFVVRGPQQIWRKPVIIQPN